MPTVSVCQIDFVGPATVLGLSGVPIANGALSSMCRAAIFDASTSGTAATAEASPLHAIAIRSFGANACEGRTG